MTECGLQSNVSAWELDWIFSRELRSRYDEVVATYSLANPLRLINTDDETSVEFDYSYFLLVRDLCRALFATDDASSICVALYHFSIGCQLERAGAKIEAESFLRSACELRSKSSVYTTTSILEAYLYQFSLKFCMTHEESHELFSSDSGQKAAWLTEARGFLSHLQNGAERMFPDERVRRNLLGAITTFMTDDGLTEEVACDICAIDYSIQSAERDRPGQVSKHADGYYMSARLSILAIYVSRIIASASESVVKEILEGRYEELAATQLESLQTLLFALQVRFQVILLKIASIKVRYGLLDGKHGFQPLDSIIQTNEAEMLPLIKGVVDGIERARNTITLHGHLWLAHGIRMSGEVRPNQDNAHLIALYSRAYWFPPLDA